MPEFYGQTAKQRISRTLYMQIDVSNERLNKGNAEGEEGEHPSF